MEIIADTVRETNREFAHLSDQELENIVFQPHNNTTIEQDLYALSRREFFLVVDNSGSMLGADRYSTKPEVFELSNVPTGQFRKDRIWSLYDSALCAAEGLFETVIALDANNTLDLIFLNPRTADKVIKVNQIEQLRATFIEHYPSGLTPMAKALERLYNQSLKELLLNQMPYITIVFTDGVPDDRNAVKTHLANITKNTDIKPEKLDTMAAYSFIQMGDDPSATQFLQTLDDELIKTHGATCNIVDTKKDDFIFGRQEGIDSNTQGPVQVLWDAMKD